jgi:TetR/AcrR family transcriptional regulator, repressor of fatR-cypB operon
MSQLIPLLPWNNKRMASKTKPSKRDAILDAMLDVVVERGFHEAPMSLIAERSSTSAGLIYHHFVSKEEIIQALYERIHTLKITSFLDGFTPEMDPQQAFVHGCERMYLFYRKHQKEMRFLEQYKNAGFACQPELNATDQRIATFLQRFSSRSKGGVLNEWPADVLQEITIGLIERLARLPRKLSSAVLREIAESLWAQVKAK